MVSCIYCNRDQADDALTLEHVIPRFLGGAVAPDVFKVRRVCRRCNHNLGLFVDAAFGKAWWVAQWQAQAAFASYNPEADVGLPLICMGISELRPPGMDEGEVCESWLGPLGEQVYWIRPRDERLYWYSGGNPVTAKQFETRAYFYFGVRSHENPRRTWLAFRDAFSDTAVRKLMCTQLQGADPAKIGFAQLDALDQERVAYFDAICSTNDPPRQLKVALNINYDYRFISKLALGCGYAMFGDAFLASDYCAELRKGVWYRDGEPEPEMRGSSAYQNDDPQFLHFSGLKHAVTLILAPCPEGMGLSFNIGGHRCWSVLCADRQTLLQSDLRSFGHGQVLVIFPYLQASVMLPWLEFIAHRSGGRRHPELVAVEGLNRL